MRVKMVDDHLPPTVDKSEPFWRHFNTQEWEPEWQTLVGVLEREHISVDWKRAFNRLGHCVTTEMGMMAMLSVYRDWLGYLYDVHYDKNGELSSEVFSETLQGCSWDVIKTLLGRSLTSADDREKRLCLCVLRGICLIVPSVRETFVGERMETLLKRLSDENETQETKVEVLELTLVVIADSKTCQRDFMRRNGLGILSEMYSSAQIGDVLMEEVKTFIGVLIRHVLPSGNSQALSKALTEEARETIEEHIGADALTSLIESLESLDVGQ